MIAWNSICLEVAYSFLGWLSFLCWSSCLYPQVLLNYRRKSVVGLNFDFPVLNLTKHTSYLIYNAAMYFSPEVQAQYHEKYGPNQMIPVGLNDVLLSINNVFLTAFTLIQIFIYKRRDQRFSKTCIAMTAIIWLYILFSVNAAWPKRSWLLLIVTFNYIQVTITTIKHIPQAVTNFKRKSTVGWSIGYVLFDLLGGLAGFGQMCAQSIDQGSTVNFYGNIGKLLLSLEVIFFDLLFIFQHYVLYPEKGGNNKALTVPGEREPLLGFSDILGNEGSCKSKDEDTGNNGDSMIVVAVADASSHWP